MADRKWEPYERYVQGGMVDGAYASGAFTLISAGPPRLALPEVNNLSGSGFTEITVEDPGDFETFPIGMVQNFSLSHNSQFNQVFEIGSERSYFVRGRTTGQINLGRVMYHGPSILRALYAHSINDTFGDIQVDSIGSSVEANMSTLINGHDVKRSPGHANLYLNLASDLFANPIGLLIKTMDTNENTIGAVYAEGCVIPQHTFSTDSQGLLVQEQVAIQFERLVPVKVEAITPFSLAFNADADIEIPTEGR